MPETAEKASGANGHVELLDGYPWADFVDWCDDLGRQPNDILGASRVHCFARRGVVPVDIAGQWAKLLGVELHDIWPSAPERPPAPTPLPGLGHAPPLPTLPSRSEQCRLELLGSYRAYRLDCEAWAEIERLNARSNSGIDVQAELQRTNRRLKCELRRIEAWYGSRVFGDVLAAFIVDAEKGEVE